MKLRIPRRRAGVAATRFRPSDLVGEAVSSLFAAPARTIGAAAGIILSSAAFVATSGLASTLSQQVSDAFDAGRATQILVQTATPIAGPRISSHSKTICPAMDLNGVAPLAGIRHVGVYNLIGSQPAGRGLAAHEEAQAPVAAIDEQSVAAMEPRLVSGRLPDRGNVERSDAVAVIPQRLANKVGLGTRAIGQRLLLGHRAFTIIGVFDDLTRGPESLDAVLVPHTTADEYFAATTSTDQVKCQAMIETAPGAASALAEQVALAISPNAPDSLTVTAPPDPQGFRRQLERPIRTLALALSLASMVIGSISISASVSNSVTARTSEIGLRKALGARRRHILLQLLGESATLGLLGSVVGALGGAYLVIAVSVVNHWQPTLDFVAALIACGAGALLGTVAGLLPALRAAKVAPIASLRR